MGEKKLYEKDFSLWIIENINALQKKELDKVDVKNIIEELRAMGVSQKNELKNRLIILIAHMLKWDFQPEYRGRSWFSTIKEQRKAIQCILNLSPSLRNDLSNYIKSEFDNAVELAMEETRLKKDSFHKELIYSEKDIFEKPYEMPKN